MGTDQSTAVYLMMLTTPPRRPGSKAKAESRNDTVYERKSISPQGNYTKYERSGMCYAMLTIMAPMLAVMWRYPISYLLIVAIIAVPLASRHWRYQGYLPQCLWLYWPEWLCVTVPYYLWFLIPECINGMFAAVLFLAQRCGISFLQDVSLPAVFHTLYRHKSDGLWHIVVATLAIYGLSLMAFHLTGMILRKRYKDCGAKRVTLMAGFCFFFAVVAAPAIVGAFSNPAVARIEPTPSCTELFTFVNRQNESDTATWGNKTWHNKNTLDETIACSIAESRVDTAYDKMIKRRIDAELLVDLIQKEKETPKQGTFRNIADGIRVTRCHQSMQERRPSDQTRDYLTRISRAVTASLLRQTLTGEKVKMEEIYTVFAKEFFVFFIADSSVHSVVGKGSNASATTLSFEEFFKYVKCGENENRSVCVLKISPKLADHKELCTREAKMLGAFDLVFLAVGLTNCVAVMLMFYHVFWHRMPYYHFIKQPFGTPQLLCTLILFSLYNVVWCPVVMKMMGLIEFSSWSETFLWGMSSLAAALAFITVAFLTSIAVFKTFQLAKGIWKATFSCDSQLDAAQVPALSDVKKLLEITGPN